MSFSRKESVLHAEALARCLKAGVRWVVCKTKVDRWGDFPVRREGVLRSQCGFPSMIVEPVPGRLRGCRVTNVRLEAPTGGYLLNGVFSTGVSGQKGVWYFLHESRCDIIFDWLTAHIKNCQFSIGHFCFDGPFFQAVACTCEVLVKGRACWPGHTKLYCTPIEFGNVIQMVVFYVYITMRKSPEGSTSHNGVFSPPAR